LIVHDFLEYGGATRINQELTKVLSKTNFLLLSGFYPSTEHLKNEFKRTKLSIFPLPDTSIIFLYSLITLKILIESFKILLKEKTDLIILNLPFSGLGVVLNPLSWNKKKVYIFHGAWNLERKFFGEFFENPPGLKNRITYFIQKFVMTSCQRIFVFSNYSRGLVINYFKINKKKVKVISPPLTFENITLDKKEDSEKLRERYANKDTLLFLIPSRIEKRKGIDLLLAAISLLKNRGLKIKFVFTGVCGGNIFYIQSLFDFFRKDELFDLVEFIGPLEREKLYHYYQIADCTIIPSVALETLGLVTLESLFFGVPVIGFKSGATPEILKTVDKRLVVEKISASHLAKKIIWFLNLKKSEKTKLKEQCRNCFKKWVNNEKNEANFYEGILS